MTRSELRWVRAACVIEMHLKRASPAGSKAAAIVHNLTAIGQQGKACYSATCNVPLKKDKGWWYSTHYITLDVFWAFTGQTWAEPLWEHLTHPMCPLFLLQSCLQLTSDDAFNNTCCNWVVFSVFCLVSHWVKLSWTRSHINSCSDHRCVSNHTVFLCRPQNHRCLCCYFCISKACIYWFVNNDRRSCKSLTLHFLLCTHMLVFILSWHVMVRVRKRTGMIGITQSTAVVYADEGLLSHLSNTQIPRMVCRLAGMLAPGYRS